jgi:hypothetical protein
MSENVVNGTFILAMALLFYRLAHCRMDEIKHWHIYLVWHNVNTSNLDIGIFASTMAHCQNIKYSLPFFPQKMPS